MAGQLRLLSIQWYFYGKIVTTLHLLTLQLKSWGKIQRTDLEYCNLSGNPDDKDFTYVPVRKEEKSSVFPFIVDCDLSVTGGHFSTQIFFFSA